MARATGCGCRVAGESQSLLKRAEQGDAEAQFEAGSRFQFGGHPKAAGALGELQKLLRGG